MSRRKIVATLATAAAPLIAYLVIRTALVGLNPVIGAAWPPETPAPLLRAAIKASMTPGARVPGEAFALVQRSAISSPLAFEPFFLAAKLAEQRGQSARALALMTEARRRRSTFFLTRVQLLVYYSKAGRYREQLDEVDFVLRSIEGSRKEVFPEMIRLLREPRGQAALAYVLAKDPPWRAEFFQAADAGRVDPNAALRLLRLVAGSRGSDVDPERQFYLRSLMAHGQSGTARRVWLDTLGPQERARSGFVFDGDFSGARGSPPFGWSLTESGAGRAEIVAERGAAGHLDVVYFGNQPAVLAEQALVLAPGTYRIQVAARRESEAQSQLLWSVSCLADDESLGKLELQGLQAEYRQIATTFTVPADCSDQRLRLRGVPGDVSGTLTVRIGRLEINRVR